MNKHLNMFNADKFIRKVVFTKLYFSENSGFGVVFKLLELDFEQTEIHDGRFWVVEMTFLPTF